MPFTKGDPNINRNGRPKGKTLKEFARELLMSLPDEEKEKFLKELPKDIVWKMAEGNPANSNDITSGGQPIPILGGLTTENEVSEDNSPE